MESGPICKRGAGKLLTASLFSVLGFVVFACTDVGKVINLPPVANDDTVTTSVDRAVVVSVLDNDVDADGDALFIDAVTQPTKGAVYVTPDKKRLRYVPHSDFADMDAFGYSVRDGNGGIANAAVTIKDSGLASWKLVPLRSAEQKAVGRIGGEAGQLAFTLAISVDDPRLIAVGLDTAGVYVSEDGGQTFEIRHNGIHSLGVQSVAFDPSNNHILWAAGLRSAAKTVLSYPPAAEYVTPAADGIYRSLDRGKTWDRMLPALYLRNWAQNAYFAFEPAERSESRSSHIYAVTHDLGLLKSDDGGTEFHEVGPGGHIYNAIVRHPVTGDLWLAAEDGLWRSTDRSRTWDPIATPAKPVRGIVLHPTNPKVVYIACSTAGVWKTTNAGKDFTQLTLPKRDWVRLAISAADPRVIYADSNRVGGGPYHSSDGGITWHLPESREPGFWGGTRYFSQGLVTHPTLPLVAYDVAPLSVTTDGGVTWQVLGNGMSGSRRGAGGRCAALFRPEAPMTTMFFHTDHGATLSSDGGDTWRRVAAPHQDDIGATTQPGGAWDPTPGSHRVISAVGGWNAQRLCMSDDDGTSWTVLHDIVDDYRYFYWHPQRTNVVYVGSKTGGLRSDDRGSTWHPLTQPVRAVYPGNGDIIFALNGRKVMRSDNRGDTFEQVGADLPVSGSDLDVSPVDPDRLYVVGQGGLWIKDKTTGWLLRDERHGLQRDFFGQLYIERVAVDPTHPNVVYTGQRPSGYPGAGVFRSTDAGDHWKRFGTNLSDQYGVWGISVNPGDGTVWIATNHGNWRITPGE